MTRKLILDLDTGIDDALALAYALASPELELIGVTATYGNVTVEQGARNSLSLLELFGRSDIPVYLGPGHAGDKNVFAVQEISAFIHGKNGIGEVELPEPAASAHPGAVDFLIESVARYGDDLVIVPTGPHTIIAAAMDKDPEFAQRAHLVFMGGALTLPGNVTRFAEANISQDPQAADTVLRRSQDATMVGLDVTLRTLLTRAETAKWRAVGTPAAEAYADMVDYYIGAYATTSPHLGGCGLHDPLAVAVAEDPSLVNVVDLAMKVETDGASRGRTIGDETRLGEKPNTRVAVGVDTERFVSSLVERLHDLFGRAQAESVR